MNILLTNDDGITAPGLAALIDELGASHTLTVVAPSVQRSAVSQTFTFHAEYRVQEIGQRRYAVSGTPVDCVMFALAHLGQFDLVISGINHGANVAWDTWYSGTVGAACEAARHGVKAMAVSVDTLRTRGGPVHYSDAAVMVRSYVDAGLAGVIPSGQVFNLNFPNDKAVMRTPPVSAAPGRYTYNVNELVVADNPDGGWTVRVVQSSTYPQPAEGTDGAEVADHATFSLLDLRWPDMNPSALFQVKHWFSQHSPG